MHRGIDALGLHPTLLVEGELAAQDEILNCDRRLGRTENRTKATRSAGNTRTIRANASRLDHATAARGLVNSTLPTF